MDTCATSTRKTHVARGFFVLATALAAAGAAYYFVITTAHGRHEIALPIALLWGSVIFMFDRELVGGTTVRTAWARIVLSAILGTTVAIPVEMRVLEGRLNQEIQRGHAAENATATGRLQQRQSAFDARKTALEQQLADIRQQQQEAIRNKEAEVVGRVIANETTGIRGEGPAYRAADNRLHELQKQAAETESSLNRVQDDRAQAAADFKNEEIGAIYDFPTRYEALKRATPAFTPLWTLSWMITLLFILFDMFPVLTKVLAAPSDYDELQRMHVAENIHRVHRIAGHNQEQFRMNFLERRPSLVDVFEHVTTPPDPE